MRTYRCFFLLAAYAVATLPWLAGCGSWVGAGLDAQDQRRSFDAAEDRKPTGNTLYALARVLMDQGRYPQAEAALVQLISDEPAMIPAYAALGTVELRLGKNAEAVRILTKGLDMAPNEPILLNNIGMCHVLDQNYGAALPYFQRAVQADGRTPRYHANLAMALAMMGDYDGAFQLYREIMPPSDAHHNLGVLSALRGDAQRADAEFAAERETAAPPAANVESSPQTPPLSAQNGSIDPTDSAPDMRGSSNVEAVSR